MMQGGELWRWRLQKFYKYLLTIQKVTDDIGFFQSKNRTAACQISPCFAIQNNMLI